MKQITQFFLEGQSPNEMLPYFDPIIARQLKDCALAVHAKKRERFSQNEIFSSELNFVIDILKKKWLAEKYFRQFKELNFFAQKRNLKGKIQLTGMKKSRKSINISRLCYS